ncbi:hypothetical protein [Kitasatospora sp. NPDC058478]|uniref:hypothetical protein n=1 Tax=unclassified Kitasatospora TaxID=2633591 RepID=UPI003664364A
MAGPPGNNAARQDLQARRAEAVRLKLTRGWSNLEIGLYLHADPAHNTRSRAVPEGYGAERYRTGDTPLTDGSLARVVGKDIARTLKSAQSKYDQDVDALRRLRVAQYEELLRVALAEAADLGDLDEWESPEDRARAADRQFRARDQALRVLTRLDEIQGVKKPVRTEVTGVDGAPLIDTASVDELRALIAANAAAEQQQKRAAADGQ